MTSHARCATCSRQLDPDAKFCGNCGAAVQAAESQVPEPTTSSASAAECPSCKHVNPPSARFCEKCGTQLQSISRTDAGAQIGVGDLRGHSRASTPGTGTGLGTGSSASEDPWATGPGYQQPLRDDEMCPRCGSHRNADESVCATCGLPFGQQANADGIPSSVALRGDPAGFWIRLVAIIIDGIIINVVLGIIGGFLGFNSLTGGGLEDYSAGAQTLIQSVFLVIQVGYGTVLLAYYGTTPGKRLFNIYILDANGNKGIGIGRALGRELSKFVSFLILLIGYIMAAFRSDKRALHDLMAGTYPTTVHRRRSVTGSN